MPQTSKKRILLPEDNRWKMANGSKRDEGRRAP